MTKKDQELLAEAYDQVNEGIFDRAKARVGQAAGAVRGLAAKGKGKLQQQAGKAVTALGAKSAGQEIQDAGQEKIDNAQTGNDAKIANYLNSITNTIVKDLKALNIDFAEAETLKEFLKEIIQDSIDSAPAPKQAATSSAQDQAPGASGGPVINSGQATVAS